MSSIVLGGGCFWCLEAIYSQVKGVKKVVSGYSGGSFKNPTYNDLTTFDTGHAEVVKIDFDEMEISLDEILKIFWHIHDPTTANRQGNDVGPQYRSVILYQEDQLLIVKRSIENIAKKVWSDPITTELSPLDYFYKAEDYHQNYYLNNPSAGYCQVIINPKLNKFRRQFSDYLK